MSDDTSSIINNSNTKTITNTPNTNVNTNTTTSYVKHQVAEGQAEFRGYLIV